MPRAENLVRATDLSRTAPYWNPEAETMPAEQLHAHQRRGVAEVWDRIWSEPIPFYADRYAAAGLSAGEVPDLDAVPRTTKDDLRADEAAHPPFGTHRSVGLDQAVRISKTTGTSGRPVFTLMGPRDLEAAIEMQARTTWTLGLRPGDRFTHPWPGGLYVSAAFTNFFYTRTGVLEIPVGPPVTAEDAREHVELWQLLRPHGFMLTMSQLQIYLDAAASLGTDFTELTAGTTVSLYDLSMNLPGPRSRMEKYLGCRIRTQSGAGDIPGFGAAECEFGTGVHVPHDYLVVQVVDPATGASLPEGRMGHLVVTTIGLDANLVRFDLEDLATLESGPCPCGRTGPRLRVWGRAAEALVLDGVTVLPVHVQGALDEHGGPEFQVHLEESRQAGRLVLSIESTGTGTAEEELLAAALGVPVTVRPIVPGSLPRAAFKPRRTG
ncbi:MAG: hypothetical protein J7518_05705 [Nocardioidaceae bacterium]|nr:hypothetical protein [Nocardioidaceae bacterium]